MSDEQARAERDAATMFRFLNEIGIIAQLAGAAFEKAMPGAMTLPQFVVLNHLTRLGGDRTPLHLATAMQVTKGTMTNTLGHLDRAGWIAIRPDAKDGRSKRIDVTEAGRSAHAGAIRAMAPELAFLSGAIAPDRIEAATPLLQDIRKVLDERRN